MAKLSRHRARHLSPAIAVLAALPGALWATPGWASEGTEVDLIGTWHVLVHYTDETSHDPNAWRWDDRIWVFEREGGKLRWSELPIVVFHDPTGRFSHTGTGRPSRVIHAWEPNAGQLAQIEEGLEVNPRGKRSKSLRGSDGEGWHSRRRTMSPSASVITYSEDWSIEGLPTLPVFQRSAVMGSAMTEKLEGVTRHAATRVSAHGSVIEGTFERDGTRHGRFRMRVAGEASDVKGSGKARGERLTGAWLGEFARILRSDPRAIEAAIQRKTEAGEGGDVAEDVRDEIRAEIERSIRSRGLDPREFHREVSVLTRKVEQQIVEQGRSVGDVARMIEEGELSP